MPIITNKYKIKRMVDICIISFVKEIINKYIWLDR